jgi:hypothetical protein
MLLHTALLMAGHDEWVGYGTWYDIALDEIVVRFHTRQLDMKLLQFRIPAHLFDPVEFAKEKWPEWFVRRGPVQLDLFKQE